MGMSSTASTVNRFMKFAFITKVYAREVIYITFSLKIQFINIFL